MTKIPVSVFLVTKNEGRHLGEVLAALTDFAEIVLVDSGSTDNTVAIAQSFGARVFHQEWLGFARQKQFAMQQCQYDWLLNLDGDEVLNPAVVAEIRQLVATQATTPQALRLCFEDLFWGRPLSPHAGKRSIVRLFRRGQAEYPLTRKVHENLLLNKGTKVVRSRQLVKHYGYDSTECLMAKKNLYSSLKAQEKFEKGKQGSLLKLVLIFPLTLFKAYVLQRHFLSGRRGLVQAYLEAMYAFLKEAKLLEYQSRAVMSPARDEQKSPVKSAD